MTSHVPRIALIYAGGTIGSELDPQTGTLRPVDFGRLRRWLPELEDLHISLSPLSVKRPKDSSEATPADWNELGQMISDNYEAFDGFVVLHGTDTMAYTASALSFMLENLAKPVIFTGSQLPLNIRRSDGRENILTALEIATMRRPDNRPVLNEVSLLFHHKLFRACRATKISTEHFDAFESPNFPPLAEVGVEIKWNDHLLKSFPSRPFQFSPIREDILLAYLPLFPGFKAEILQTIVELENMQVLVLETFGTGNAPDDPNILTWIRRAGQKGIPIINISSCKRGGVRQTQYETGRRLAEAGALPAFDMTREACVAKIYYLLSRSISIESWEKYWYCDLRGEITC
ncbi:MAG: asparaginase [Flavobacteriales bacterium]|nr:asparaginase [Flavobacteriales bacterium]MCX7768533.1 asparaginase [Flavobacteriales bacterium]MDW8410221.1 asparaginase [Flavobacteriales bacterium]